MHQFYLINSYILRKSLYCLCLVLYLVYKDLSLFKIFIRNFSQCLFHNLPTNLKYFIQRREEGFPHNIYSRDKSYFYLKEVVFKMSMVPPLPQRKVWRRSGTTVTQTRRGMVRWDLRRLKIFIRLDSVWSVWIGHFWVFFIYFFLNKSIQNKNVNSLIFNEFFRH